MHVWLGFLAASLCAGQMIISAVVNSANGQAYTAPGAIVSIYGSNLATSAIGASSLPWPTVLGNTSVRVCAQGACQDAPLLFASPGLINTVLTGVYGAAAATIQVQAGNSVTSLAPITVSPSAPAIYEEGYDCPFEPSWGPPAPCGLLATFSTTPQPFRGAITDLAGNIIQSANPARVGQVYTIWGTGLGFSQSGALPSPTPPFISITHESLYGFTVYLGVGTYKDTFGNPEFVVNYVGPSPTYQGLDQLNFEMLPAFFGVDGVIAPPPYACGVLKYELTLTIAAQSQFGIVPEFPVSIQLPVLIEPGDIPCNQP